MIAKRIAGTTHVLGAPKGWDHERDGSCGSLCVRRIGDNYESAWEPTPAEIEALVQGGQVVLRICGLQPPVQLWIEPAK